MSFQLELTDLAFSDIEKHRRSGDKKLLVKINKIFDELREHPESGTGKPERLKYYSEATWSRRISGKHRLIYRIENERVVVLILSVWGHYGDKREAYKFNFKCCIASIII